ncbi:MAG: hypothetical protein IKH40_01715, partial [Bacteroidales bacterium]|nr:hypothetical protein [Bacteroidales bacterium]
MKRLFLLLLPLALLPACNAPKEVSYLDKTLPAEVRAADLLSKLTLEEKTALVQYESQAIPRLGIPAYNWWNEALHGVARNGSATVFPQPIGMAASFDTEKIEAVFTAVSDEARVKNREARESAWQDDDRYWDRIKPKNSILGKDICHLKTVCWVDVNATMTHVYSGKYKLYLNHCVCKLNENSIKMTILIDGVPLKEFLYPSKEQLNICREIHS